MDLIEAKKHGKERASQEKIQMIQSIVDEHIREEQKEHDEADTLLDTI